MNEQLIVNLVRNGRPLELSGLVAEQLGRGGLIFNDESSAWPCGLRLDFQGVGAFGENLNVLRNQTAGGSHRFRLEIQDDRLVITTLRPERIPTGTYDVGLRVAHLEFEDFERRVEFREGGPPVQLELRTRAERHSIELLDTIHSDDLISRLITGSSLLDGRQILDWLTHELPRVKRKACLLNLFAAMRTTPTQDAPLLRFVEDIFHADVDRIYAKVNPELLDVVENLDKDPRIPFSEDKGPILAVHKDMLRRIPQADQDATERYKFRSFRQDAQPSLQIVIAVPPDEPGRGMYADIDIDLGNPKRDLAGFFIHLGEIMAEGQTDHIKMHKRLKKDATLSAHLHYTIAKKDG
jgi:hypothetical protein